MKQEGTKILHKAECSLLKGKATSVVGYGGQSRLFFHLFEKQGETNLPQPEYNSLDDIGIRILFFPCRLTIPHQSVNRNRFPLTPQKIRKAGGLLTWNMLPSYSPIRHDLTGKEQGIQPCLPFRFSPCQQNVVLLLASLAITSSCLHMNRPCSQPSFHGI